MGQTEEPKMLKLGSAHGWRPKQACLCLVAVTLLLEFFSLPPLTSGQTIQEVRVQWTTPPPPAAGAEAKRPAQSTAQLFSILDRQKMRGRLPRQREPELSSDKIVIIARDTNGTILDWQVVSDPRVVRSEGPGPGGELTGRVLYRDRADFLFTLPDDPGITRIDFYHPRWTGEKFDLDLIGGVPLQ
jgi:hypothetical protein